MWLLDILKRLKVLDGFSHVDEWLNLKVELLQFFNVKHTL